MSRKIEISFQTLISNLKINLEEEKACRICAAKGVKMYDLHTQPWGGYFETITGMSPLVDVSHNACYQCAALMRKYYLFKQKCLHRQSIFYEYFSSNIEENTVDIDKSSPNFNLSVYNVPPERTYKYVYNNDKDESVKEEITCVGRNVESDEIFDQDDLTLQSSVNSPIDDNDSMSLSRIEISNNIIKEENDSSVQNNSDVDEKLTDMKSEVLLVKNKEDSDTEEVIEPKIINLRSLKIRPSTSHREEAEMAEYCKIIKLSKEEQIEEIMQRKNTRNYKCSPYKCDMCYKGFIDSLAFRNHMKKHDQAKGDLECPVCRFRFPKRYLLLKHAAVNHDKKYMCKKCDNVSKSKDQAVRHEKWHEGVTYKCKYCEEVLTKWTSYMSHMRIKHPSEFICGECGNSFVSRLGLSLHKSMMHKDTAKMKKESLSGVVKDCMECDVQFTSLQAWKRHLVVSIKHKPKNDIANRCRHCGDIFNSKDELRAHGRLEHPPTRIKRQNRFLEAGCPIKCKCCDELFDNGREYWNHFRRLHPDKEYPKDKSHICEICGKGFQGKTSLKYHMQSHSDERSYKCEQCPKSFFNRFYLQKHEKIHSEHRAYSCDICFKAFKLQCGLYRHYRIHTGVKPYKCELCGKAFSQSNSKKLHVRTVHMKEPTPYISKNRLKRRRADKPVTSADKPAPPADIFTPPATQRRRRTARAQDSVE